MEKQYKAKKAGPNKWVRKTGWKLNKADIAGIAVIVLVVGYVTIRSLIG